MATKTLTSYIHLLCIVLNNIIVFGNDSNHAHSPLIGSRNPINIKILTFSPGGEHFYEKYFLTHKPLVIRNAAKSWPLVQKWKSQENLDGDKEEEEDSFYSQFLPISTDSESRKETVRDIIAKELVVSTKLTSNSELLVSINIPLILQCQEYIDKIDSIELNVNNAMRETIQFSMRDELVIAFDKSIYVLIFGADGNQFKEVNMVALDMTKHPEITLVELHPGDILYIPRYTFHHIKHTQSTVSFTKIKFDFYAYDFNMNIPYEQILDEYKIFLGTQPRHLQCNNTKSTFGHSLNLAINFDNALETSHLRIPKKNKRPEDIVLASGHKMPVLGLGTALLNETTYEAVMHALTYSYRLFDLAHAYPHSETSFSRALADSLVPREDVFVVTKLAPRYLGYEETLFAIDDSLKRLNTTYIDLYLIHAMECDDFLLTCAEGEPKGTWKDSWRAMEHAKNIGKIRSLGVSNFYKPDLYELLSWSVEPVSVVQNWFDPFNPDKETRKICTEYNIRYMGYSTLGNYWKLLGMDFNPVFASSTITGIAAHYDYVISSVVLRWAIHENVTVIPRSANPKHIGQNIRALDLSLLQEEYDMINGFDDWMSEMKDGELNMANEDIAKWVKKADAMETDNTSADTKDGGSNLDKKGGQQIGNIDDKKLDEESIVKKQEVLGDVRKEVKSEL